MPSSNSKNHTVLQQSLLNTPTDCSSTKPTGMTQSPPSLTPKPWEPAPATFTPLPTLQRKISAFPLFEHLHALQKKEGLSVDAPLDPYVSEAELQATARQTEVNTKVRILLKERAHKKLCASPEPGRCFSEPAPAFIQCATPHEQPTSTQDAQPSASFSSDEMSHSSDDIHIIETPSEIDVTSFSHKTNLKKKRRRQSSASSISYECDSSNAFLSPSLPGSSLHISLSQNGRSRPSSPQADADLSPFLEKKCSLLRDGDPPWMTFIGHQPLSGKKSSGPICDWRESLTQMNQQLDFFGHLHEEICALVSWLDPTPEELLLRQRALAKVTLVVKSLWPQAEVNVFGSYYTGLWLPNGDLDLCIMNVEGDQVTNLRMLAVCLSRMGIPLALEVISSARVPIVKFVDSESGISVDISLNTDSAKSTTDYVAKKLRKYPWLRPLILFVKLYLQHRSLGETYRGGVGSYLLFTLCLSFIQQHRILTDPKRMSSISLGHLLFDFFQLYGRDFNFDTTAISVRKGGSYFPKTQPGWFNTERPSLLAVESPLAPDMDIGRNSYDIRSVRCCFRQSFLVLTELLHDWVADRIPKDRSLLQHLLFPFEDPLMLHRKRQPLRLSGNSALERSFWWKTVCVFFDRPIGEPRPSPVLPPEVLEQVQKELDSAVGSVLSSVKSVTREIYGSRHSDTSKKPLRRRSQDQGLIRNIEAVENNTDSDSDSVDHIPLDSAPALPPVSTATVINPFAYNNALSGSRDPGLQDYKRQARKKKQKKVAKSTTAASRTNMSTHSVQDAPQSPQTLDFSTFAPAVKRLELADTLTADPWEDVDD